MPRRRPPTSGHRSANWPVPGGRRRTDPPIARARVAVLRPQSHTGSPMADDLKETGKHGHARINVDQDHDLDYWADKLGVSREDLRRAIQQVGPMVKDVEQ